MMARHINPNDPARTATAPYNFVPLPNKIFSVEEGIEVNGKKVQPWKMHDQFVPGTQSGWIDLKITSLTPLFIRDAVVQTDGEWDRRDTRLRPEPYVNKDGTPVIPGSSLRGMIRNMVEVLSFSKILSVTDEKPFFRSVSNDRIGKVYRKKVIHGQDKPAGGYITKVGNRWSITPVAEVLQVHHNLLSGCGIPNQEQTDQNYHPSWFYQHKPCWVKRSTVKSDKIDHICFTERVGWEKARLVLTGFVINKKHEFVFIGEETEKQIDVPESIWRRFHDSSQLTQWQEKAFPKNSPPAGGRKENGYLRDGEPVFFLVKDAEKNAENPEGLVFFGRAQMFRFPYDLSPWALIPEELKNSGLDIAEVLFGMVGKETIKGRVFFDDAVAEGQKSDWFEDIIVPRILASPKVTCFQHYLTQDGTKSSEELTTYLVGDKTTVRGHKHYWHRWDDNNQLDKVKETAQYNKLLNELQLPNPHDSQHTLIRPVKNQVEFRGRIRFHNLSVIELGALLAALKLPEGYAHKLGMGKPLGLGSIHIETELFVVNREKRYESWENHGVNAQDSHVFLDAFEKQISAHARNSHETIDESKQGLSKIARLEALFYLLSWDEKPSFSDTEYMPLELYKERRVLLTPHGVKSQPEPAWRVDPPRKASQSSGTTKKKPIESTNKDIVVTKPVVSPKAVAPKEILKGQQRNGFLMRKGEIWIAMFEGDDREAVILNTDAIPKDATESDIAEFYIMEQSKKIGIRVRFNKLAIKE
jgi:CRISPR-associated protein (TIGR03986 family)